MKKTGTYELNLMESSDLMSAKPLNENAEKIDAALKAQAETAAGKLMMAAGRYTGSGTRSVTIQTPGFRPKALMLRRAVNGWDGAEDAYWWLGSDVPATYNITAASDTPPDGYEPGEQFTATIRTTISFTADSGSLTWLIPDIPQEYYDVTSDGGPAALMNSRGVTYEWIALGTAQ